MMENQLFISLDNNLTIYPLSLFIPSVMSLLCLLLLQNLCFLVILNIEQIFILSAFIGYFPFAKGICELPVQALPKMIFFYSRDGIAKEKAHQSNDFSKSDN